MVLVLDQLPPVPAFLEFKPKHAFSMKSTTLITAALVALAPIVQADNCKPGLNYCGYGLLKKGNYYTQINEQLLSNKQPSDSNHINQSLFKCIGGKNGDIDFIKYCGTCKDGGSGHSDYC